MDKPVGSIYEAFWCSCTKVSVTAFDNCAFIVKASRDQSTEMPSLRIVLFISVR